MAYDKDDPGAGLDGKPLAGLDLIKRVKEITGDTILLSFSGGKDSIAMWLYLREHFEIIPYFLYWVPGLSFVEESMAYYEDFFDTEIVKCLTPYSTRCSRVCVSTARECCAIDGPQVGGV